METPVVSVPPQAQRGFLPQWRAGNRHTLDVEWKHHRVSGEKDRRRPATPGKLNPPLGLGIDSFRTLSLRSS